MENCYKIKDLFTQQELEWIDLAIQNAPTEDDPVLGRVTKHITKPSNNFLWKLIQTTNSTFNKELVLGPITYTRYSAKFGKPNLPPHIDRDKVEVIVDYQYKSNTNWPLGLNKTIYEMEDNSALMFNPNKNIHWRPIKDFDSEEFVEMIFFRFFEIENGQVVSDYTDVLPREGTYNPELEEVEEFRNKL